MRFISYIAIDVTAYETGYFKSVTSHVNGKVRTQYSYFQIVLRKEKNTYRVLIDSDTNQRGSTTEEIFLRTQPLE